MAITIPGTGGDYTDFASDISTQVQESFRNAHRFRTPTGVRTERSQIVGDQFEYKGRPQRFWGMNVSGRAALHAIAIWAPQMVDEMHQRGMNFARLHHLDQKNTQGGMLDSTASNWYALQVTEAGRLVSTIKALRHRGMYYTLDLNSRWGNGFDVNLVLTGMNAADIWATDFVSSTVNGAASSTTQTLVDVADLTQGMGLFFVTTNAVRTIVSVNAGANTVTLDSSISTTNGETVQICTDGFKHLPPINNSADFQFKAYAEALLSLNVADSGTLEIGNDPHCLYITITNEHFPGGTLSTRIQRHMDDWYGSAWSHTDAIARAAYADQCADWLELSFRPWMASHGWGDLPLAWGSQFGTNYTEYDVVKAAVDVHAIHVYRHEAGVVGATFDGNEVHMQGDSVEDILSPRDPWPRGGVKPIIVEEWNGSYPQRYRHEVPLLGAAWAALNNISGVLTFDWADGTYNPTSPPHSRQYQVQGDRPRDLGSIPAVGLYIRKDLPAIEEEDARNFHFEDRINKYWGVDSDRTILLIANAGEAVEFNKGEIITISGGRVVAFVQSSFDASPIYEAKRLLIGYYSYSIRRNVVLNDSWTQMTNAGSGATALAHCAGTIKFRHSLADKLQFFRLGHDGSRGAEIVPTSVVGDVVTLDLAIDASNQTMMYEAAVAGSSVSGGGGVGAGDPLPDGWYWHEGVYSAGLLEHQGWLAWNGTARITSTNDSITIVHKRGSSGVLDSLALDVGYEGEIADWQAFDVEDAQTEFPLLWTPFPTHLEYADESNTATPHGTPPTCEIIRYVLTSSEVGISVLNAVETLA